MAFLSVHMPFYCIKKSFISILWYHCLYRWGWLSFLPTYVCCLGWCARRCWATIGCRCPWNSRWCVYRDFGSAVRSRTTCNDCGMDWPMTKRIASCARCRMLSERNRLRCSFSTRPQRIGCRCLHILAMWICRDKPWCCLRSTMMCSSVYSCNRNWNICIFPTTFIYYTRI